MSEPASLEIRGGPFNGQRVNAPGGTWKHKSRFYVWQSVGDGEAVEIVRARLCIVRDELGTPLYLRHDEHARG